ncbi:MAG: D-mannonate epimerase, partial [Bacteroidales bacterium]|nr:D-mannonate epimerase [Bacteroidales bacterium]
MIYHQQGSETTSLSPDDLRQGLYAALEKFGRVNRVLAVPPDQTRIHSGAGALTRMAYEYYGDRLTDIMPALGTHNAMSINDLNRMYPGIPHHLFRVHDWRNDVVTLGEIPGDFISEITNGALSYPWPAQLNKLIWNGHHDLILSIGQVVPHEVIGMANYNKNLLVGCGGPDGINKSHFLGAVYGMERIMGRADNPVRAVLNEADKRFMKHLPVLYVLTVIGTQSRKSRNSATRQHAENNPLITRGLFIGDDDEVFNLASKLSLKVNFTQLEQPLQKVVVYLDPVEFRSTWLGNKAIYRTRMAIADGGELIILAPGVKEFGEDPEIDRLIRKYGYRGTPAILDAVKNN